MPEDNAIIAIRPNQMFPLAMILRLRYAGVVSDSTQYTLTMDQVRHVAKLSRLSLSDAELEQYRGQLGAVLGYITKLNQLDLEGVEPLAHPSGQTNQLDDDEPQSGLALEQVLRNAPAVMDRYFSVPKVLGEGGG